MLSRIATIISERLVSKEIIKKDETSIYIYGLELILSFVFSTVIVLIIGFILNCIFSTIMFLTIFIILRRFTGGFHAKTYAKCQICTISISTFVMIASKYITVEYFSFLTLAFLSYPIIILFAPIKNPHKNLSNKKKKKNKFLSVIFFSIFLLSGVALINSNTILCNTIFLTLSVVIALMLVPLLKERS